MSDSGPAISVVIPTCDRVDLLKRAIDSVLSQSFKNYEIIVVDDHSEDGTPDFLRSLEDPRLRFISRRERGGGAAARNTGIGVAAGDFVAFLDDDDAWHSNKLQRQFERMKQLPEVGMLYTGTVHIFQDSGRIYRTVNPRYRGEIFNDLLMQNMIGTTSSIMVRRQALMEVGGFDELFPSCQDWDLYLRLAQRWPIDFVDQSLVNFFLHPVRITHNYDAGIKGRKMILKKYRPYIGNNSKILSLHFAAIGKLCCQAGRYAEGRHFLLKATRQNPGNMKVYKHLLPLLIGGRFYQEALKFKRRLVTLWSEGSGPKQQKKGAYSDE